MGRRALNSPRKRVNLYIEENLIARFALANFDPSSRTGYNYGALSERLNILLREHLDELEAERSRQTFTEAMEKAKSNG